MRRSRSTPGASARPDSPPDALRHAEACAADCLCCVSPSGHGVADNGACMAQQRKRNQDEAIALQGALWMTVGDESLGGRGRIGLLQAIAEQGSITQAAKAFGMSYKAAWDAVDAMNNLAGAALVERSTGGRGGGSTRLTPRG